MAKFTELGLEEFRYSWGGGIFLVPFFFFFFQIIIDGQEFQVYSSMQVYSKWTFDRPFPQTLLKFIANSLVSFITTNLYIPLPNGTHSPILTGHFDNKILFTSCSLEADKIRLRLFYLATPGPYAID